MENIKDVKDIKEESSDSEEIEAPVKLTATGKVKKPYVLTEARKAQFEKARFKRQENLAIKRDAMEEKLKVFNAIKQDLVVKKEMKVRKQKAKEVRNMMEELSNDSETDNDSEEEMRVLKHKLKMKQERKEKKVSKDNFAHDPLIESSVTPIAPAKSVLRYF